MYTQRISAQSDFNQSDMYTTTGTDYNYTPNNQAATEVSAGLVIGYFIILAIVAAIMIPSLWKIFTKAGRPGWNALVPVYNQWVLLELGGKPGWWAVVAFVPIIGLVSIVFAILSAIELAKRFGKSDGFAILMILLPIVAYPILAFGKATYDASRGTAPTVGDAPYPTSGANGSSNVSTGQAATNSQPQQPVSAPTPPQPQNQAQQPAQPQSRPPQPPSNLIQ